jgi:hypothetical protein
LFPTPGIFTATVFVPALIVQLSAPPSRATFSASVPGLGMAVNSPAGIWIASVSMPQLALTVPVPVGVFTVRASAPTLGLQKTVVLDDAARVLFGALDPAPMLRLFSPPATFTANTTAIGLNRGTSAVPAETTFSAPVPAPHTFSSPAIYTYPPGDIVDSNSWPDHVGA